MVYQKEEPICRNCGSHDIGYDWVKRQTKPENIDISLEKYAENLALNRSWTPFGLHCEGIYTPQLKDFCQLVIKCKECGFTKVFDSASLEKA